MTSVSWYEFYIRENIVFSPKVLETCIVMYMCVCIVEFLYKEGQVR